MMKKVILGLIAAAAMTSCIKRQEVTTDQNSNLGKGTVTGTIMYKSNYVADTLANGNVDFDNLGVSGLAGLNVVATYNTNDLDPDNVNGEEVSLATTTNANGVYSFAIDATGQGTEVTISIDGIVKADVFTDNTARVSIDPNTFQPIPETQSLTFSADDIPAASRNYTVTVNNGESETKAKVVLEAEEL